MASFPDVDDVSPALRGHSSFFMQIRSVTEALNKLNSFLECAEPESVERLMTEFTESLADHQAEECFEVDGVADLSLVLQERRVVDFLGRACSRVRSLVSRARELRSRRLVHSFVDEYFDSSEKNAVAWLTEEEPSRSILSLSGCNFDPASLLEYDTAARGGFDPLYWIDVSGLYKIENLFQITKDREQPRFDQPLVELDRAMNEMKCIDKLMRHSIRRNRFMFVFDDDVFHREFWKVIKQALNRCAKPNWAVTTTNASGRAVSSFVRGSFDQLHKLGPLADKESWELFCRIAFRDEPGRCCPYELRLLSSEIVQMCKGFPLPIEGVAGLLSTRGKQEPEWERVRNSFRVEVKTNQHLPRGIDDLAQGSIPNLPDHLLQCFSYFGVFPQDSVIPNDKLFKLWIAEGFVKEDGEKTLEEVAEEYLNELIRRNLVQSFRGLNRLEPFCRVDRLLHPTTPFESSKLNFFDKRLSICTTKYVEHQCFNSELLSLFVFGGYHGLHFMKELIRQCKMLTVLDFENLSIEELPEEFGKLIQLKYLSLKNTRLRKFPKSVDKLVNLQTLDVRNTLLAKLPAVINMLTNLRHLLADLCDNGISADPAQGVRLSKGVGRLLNLHTLTTVETHENGASVIKEISALHQLRTLGMSGLTAKNEKALCKCLSKLVRLKSLTLQAMNGEEVLNLASISSELPLLQRLVLKGQFPNLPNWIFHLQNLSVLCLSLTRLTEEQLILLSHLPNLVTLWLCRAYKGERLYFKQGSFKKLKLLVLREFHGLFELEIRRRRFALS